MVMTSPHLLLADVFSHRRNTHAIAILAHLFCLSAAFVIPPKGIGAETKSEPLDPKSWDLTEGHVTQDDKESILFSQNSCAWWRSDRLVSGLAAVVDNPEGEEATLTVAFGANAFTLELHTTRGAARGIENLDAIPSFTLASTSTKHLAFAIRPTTAAQLLVFSGDSLNRMKMVQQGKAGPGGRLGVAVSSKNRIKISQIRLFETPLKSREEVEGYVLACMPWRPLEYDLCNGVEYRLLAEGRWSWVPGTVFGSKLDANGGGGAIGGLSAGSLKARISASPGDIPIGKDRILTFAEKTRIWVRINDTGIVDNTGAIRFRIAPVRDEKMSKRPASATFNVIVKARAEWQDSGIDLRTGRDYVLTASGSVEIGPGRSVDAWGQPDGVLAGDMRGARPFRLIGRIGADGEIFEIGAYLAFRPRKAGRLFLRINDSVYEDNSGTLEVTVAELK